MRVLFLTDGSGGAEEIADREAYRERRREEAGRGRARPRRRRAATASSSRTARSTAICARRSRASARALLTQRPDLLLVPSSAGGDPRPPAPPSPPSTGCWRRCAIGDRDELDEALRGLRILLYEVNHPGHPDLLVDVTAEQEVLEAAMALLRAARRSGIRT